MREGGPSDQPIIGKWKQGVENDPVDLGAGYEADVTGKSFTDQAGESHGYAYKEYQVYTELEEAQKNYLRLKEAGLPVASFLKVHYTQKADGSRIQNLIMEDMSEQGAYSLEVIADGFNFDHKWNPGLIENKTEIMENMVRALAVIHNNGMYHTHDGMSFFIRTRLDNSTQGDFVVLDYSNFLSLEDKYGDPGQYDAFNYVQISGDIQRSLQKNIIELLHHLPTSIEEHQTLYELYLSYRDQKVTQYDAE
jgi:hypothetical protein